MDRFGKVCSLQSFKPFKSAKDALEQINAISEGVCTDLLHNFLEQNLPRIKD
jgi:nucleolar protein 56